MLYGLSFSSLPLWGISWDSRKLSRLLRLSRETASSRQLCVTMLERPPILYFSVDLETLVESFRESGGFESWLGYSTGFSMTWEFEVIFPPSSKIDSAEGISFNSCVTDPSFDTTVAIPQLSQCPGLDKRGLCRTACTLALDRWACENILRCSQIL